MAGLPPMAQQVGEPWLAVRFQSPRYNMAVSMKGGVLFGSFYEVSCNFGSISSAPDCWQFSYRPELANRINQESLLPLAQAQQKKKQDFIVAEYHSAPLALLADIGLLG